MLTTSSLFYWKIQIPQPLKETDKGSDIKNRHLDKSLCLDRNWNFPSRLLYMINKKVEIIPFYFVFQYIQIKLN